MLPSRHRLTSPADFRTVVRRGRRHGSPRLVVHLHLPGDATTDTHPGHAARVGFTVSKAVGGAVVRNRVRRRLRHLVADRLEALPGDTRVVVRALPPAADSCSSELGSDLDAALGRLLGRLPVQQPGRAEVTP